MKKSEVGECYMKKHKSKKRLITMVVLCVAAVLVIVLLVVFPPSSGRLPKPKSPNGLAERIQVMTDEGSLEIMLFWFAEAGRESLSIFLKTAILLHYPKFSLFATGTTEEPGHHTVRIS